MLEVLLILPSVALTALLWQEKRDRSIERKERDLKEIGLLNRIENRPIDYGTKPPEPSEEPLYVDSELDSEWEDYLDERAKGRLN